MSLPVAYRLEARDDIDSAYTNYEDQRLGLGDEFLAALRDRENVISDNPALYTVVYKDVRAAPLRRFPYVVYYQIETARILIVAVQHGRRNSRSWQRRV